MTDPKFLKHYPFSPNSVILLEGTRRFENDDYDKLVATGKSLASDFPSVHFRSGNASGSDTAFIKGVSEVTVKVQLILPYKDHRFLNIPAESTLLSLDELDEREVEELKKISCAANPERKYLFNTYKIGGTTPLQMKAAYLLRDTLKVVGLPRRNFEKPNLAFFYVNKEKPFSGGTGHTMRVCQYYNIPYYTQNEFFT